MTRGKPNVRRIRRICSYTVPELASALGVATGTIRRWVRNGMPVIDTQRPKLVNGGQFRAWHDSLRSTRKTKCGPRQMYCFKCRDARDIMPGSAVIIHRNEKSATVKALCIACATNMNRHCSKQNTVEWVDLARPLKGQKPRLVASLSPLVDVHFGAPSEAKAG